MATMAFAGVTVSSPKNGSTVSSPVHVVAYASSSYPTSAMRVYVDGNSVYSNYSNKIDAYIPMSAGGHYVVVQAWDSTGAVFKTPVSINVSGTASGVTVTSPTNGATVGSPVHFTAYAKSAYPITGMWIYSDGNGVYATKASSLDTYVNLPSGSHYVIVQAWDSTGAVFKSAPMTFSVNGSSTVPSTAKTYTNIDQMSGWESCSVCAGIGASGPVAQYSTTQGRSSPSMDGSSQEFWIGGATPYSNALWWKQLGGNTALRRFVYDLYFYVKTPQYAQALEFDVNHSSNGKKYIMGVQCNIRHTGQWEVWDGMAKTWRTTGVACSVPPAYTWNHLVEEFTHDNYGNLTFVSITLNGNKHYINRTYGSIGSSVSEVNVAFQMDGDYAQHAYSVWLDKIMLSSW